MTYYAGLDVSLRSTHICVIDDEGELLAEGKTDSEVADIITFLDELDVEITEVGLEAGTLTQYLTYGLQFAGYEVVCMEARQVKAALSAMRSRRHSRPCATRPTRTMHEVSHSCCAAAGTAACT
jgi:transposase